MNIPITRKTLLDWGGEQALRDAENIVANGQVLEADYSPPLITGAILHNNRALKTSCRITPDQNIENLCPCYTNRERGLICPHVLALGLTLINRATDPEREAKYQEELRRASRLADIDEGQYIKRVKPDTPGAIPACVRIGIASGWPAKGVAGTVRLSCSIEYRGRKITADQVPRDVPLIFAEKDEALLFVLEDIAGGPVPGSLEVTHADFINVLRLLQDRKLEREDGSDITINAALMKTILRISLDRETGELILIAHTELPFVKNAEIPVYFISGKEGFVYGADNLWPLENILPGPYRAIYAEPIIVARENVLRFFRQELKELEKYTPVESDISLDLFTIAPAKARFVLDIKGSPASLSGRLSVTYENIDLVAGKPDSREHFSLPDHGDILYYTVRNHPAEKKALELLGALGMHGECGDDLASIVGKREVLNFLGTAMPLLRRHGWKVNILGSVTDFMDSIEHIVPVVHIIDDDDDGWFEIGFDFEDGNGTSTAPTEIQRAIQMNDSFLEQDGRVMLLDSDAINSMKDVFSDCESQGSAKPGYFRLPKVYSSFVKSSLDALDGIDVECSSRWRDSAARNNRTITIDPVKLGTKLESVLRGYQKDGVYWLRMLEENGFCGLLADEMGLGKTIQALAWLQMDRVNSSSGKNPALIVCPTSLVENWAEEVEKFTPFQKTLVLTGSDRQSRWKKIPASDIAITSYAILRKDIDEYTSHEFSAVVLDEAQHIKNKSTQNAQAAKKLNAFQKLVLTGTPIENSVSDLWSIMDFLMPGYLSSHERFRKDYEIPISKGDRMGEIAKVKLRRKLHPFLLRRLKTDVAADLPEKIEKISACTLSPDQRSVYNQLLKDSRSQINRLVTDGDGFNKNRFQILTILMRLRQVCCHLGLLKLKGKRPAEPSAKMELFFELVDEAMDSGHRILVFSQFVSMLTILRKELESRGLAYCYLDGATKERQSVVRQFNTDRNIPMFLISLKAGGTGLNLTGADMVVHFDPWWNPAVEDQATDRAHRIGQKRTVYSIKLITRNTIEEKVLHMQKKKQALIDTTIVSDENYIQTLSWEDISDLLEL